MKRYLGSALVAVVVAAGCSGSDLGVESESANTSTRSEQAADETTTSSSTTTTSTTTAPARSGPRDRLQSARQVSTAGYQEADFGGGSTGYEGIAFDSPTGNITCQILSGASDGSGDPPPSLTCNVRERDVYPSPPPGGCGDLRWQPGLISLDRAGTVDDGTCASSSGPLSATVLPYGSALSGEGFGCLSEKTGVTCLVLDSGRGFRIRRAGLDRY